MAEQFVSEQALAETYDADTGWDTVIQYRHATRLREENPDMARAEIARRVGRPASAVRGWLAAGKTPRAVTGIRTAQERGWINVETESERFRALNQLIAWIYAGGGIARDTFVPHFSADDSLALATLSQYFRWLHLDYRCRDPDGEAESLEVIPAEGGAVLGRVLGILGAPRGIKAQNENLTLPTYLSTVACDHRRDFARIYLLNRGRFETADTTGTYIQTTQSGSYATELHDLFEAVASGSVTQGSKQRLWVPASVTRDLIGATPVRSGLATAAMYGTRTPPTDRAVASTFRRLQSPGGYRYHQLHQIVRKRDDSRANLAAELGIPESSIQSWRRESRPYATNALKRARERGWITPPVDSEIATTLTALLTWLLARGSLRDTYYPVFGAETMAQRDRFEILAKKLEISYETVRPNDPNWPTELRPTEDGSLLGRVLYALGAPRQSEPQTTALLPPIVYHASEHARQVVDIWCLHHGDTLTQTQASEPLHITVPLRAGEYFSDALANLFHAQLGWTVDRQTDQKLVVSDHPD